MNIFIVRVIAYFVCLITVWAWQLQTAHADVIDNAFRVCEGFKHSGITSECSVNGWKSTIDVRIDTNGIEAQKMCVGFKAVLAQQKTYFGGTWTHRIFSPFSGEHPLATCILP
jgi:hypothetical protein